MKFDKSRVYFALNAEELKVGDKVYAADNPSDLEYFVENEQYIASIVEIYPRVNTARFRVKYLHDGLYDDYCLAYLVERAKEKKYRPYESVDEFVSDFIQRTNTNCPKYGMPLIWIKSKDTSMKHLVRSFYAGVEEIGISSNIIKLNWLFNEYEYLDGSPCGKEIID
jgi:intein/homing endonuclease